MSGVHDRSFTDQRLGLRLLDGAASLDELVAELGEQFLGPVLSPRAREDLAALPAGPRSRILELLYEGSAKRVLVDEPRSAQGSPRSGPFLKVDDYIVLYRPLTQAERKQLGRQTRKGSGFSDTVIIAIIGDDGFVPETSGTGFEVSGDGHAIDRKRLIWPALALLIVASGFGFVATSSSLPYRWIFAVATVAISLVLLLPSADMPSLREVIGQYVLKKDQYSTIPPEIRSPEIRDLLSVSPSRVADVDHSKLAVPRVDCVDRSPLHRNAGDRLLLALFEKRFVILVGGSKSDRSCLAFEVIRRALPDALFIAPRGTRAIQLLLEREETLEVLSSKKPVLWLDGLENYIADGLSLGFLNGLPVKQPEVVIVATAHSDAIDREQTSLLNHASIVSLDSSFISGSGPRTEGILPYDTDGSLNDEQGGALGSTPTELISPLDPLASVGPSEYVQHPTLESTGVLLGGTARPVPRRARDRILAAASTIFQEEGISAVGVNRILTDADVAPMTLYRQFGGKDALVAAVIEQWSFSWLRWLEDAMDRRGDDPIERFDGLWDALEAWSATEGFKGSLVMKAATELRSEPDHPAQSTIAAHRQALRQVLEDLAKMAGAVDPGVTAAQLQILVEGTIDAAAVDRNSAAVRSARALATATLAAASG